MDFNKTLDILSEKENPWYTVRLWLPNGEKEDDSFQAKDDQEAKEKTKNPKHKLPKGTEVELRKVKSGKYGETEHLMDFKF